MLVEKFVISRTCCILKSWNFFILGFNFNFLEQNPSATTEVLDKEGWLNTGDIGWIAPNNSTGQSRHCGGMLILEGRSKDTIVLTTGTPFFMEGITLLKIMINMWKAEYLRFSYLEMP